MPIFLHKTIIGFLILTISGVAALFFSQSQFGGYDLSPLIDLVWRFHNGEIPGLDFINTFPPGFLVLSKIASIHPTWNALTFVNILFTTLVFILLYLSDRLRDTMWITMSSLIICIPLVYSNHIWHSSFSQLISILFYFFTSNYLRCTDDKESNLFYLILGGALIILAKQNLAPPLLILTLAFIILYDKGEKKFLALASISTGIFSGFFISYYYLGYSLDNFFYIYSSTLGRSRPDPAMYTAFLKVLSHYPLFILIALLIYISRNAIVEQISKFGCNGYGYDLIIITASLIPILTDWDTKENNISLPLFVLANMVNLREKEINSCKNSAFRYCNNLFLVLILSVFGVAFTGGYLRERMMHVGDFYDKAAYKTELSYFGNMDVGTRFSCVVKEIGRFKGGAGKNIFFGPRIEFGYQLIGARSPSKLPLWMHPGTSYKISEENLVIKAFIRSNFETIIFLKDDRTRMPKPILNFIGSNYEMDSGYSCLDVYKPIRRHQA